MSLLITDIFVTLAAMRLAYWVKFQSGLIASPFGVPEYHTYAQMFSLAVIFMLVFFRQFGLYLEEKTAHFTEETVAIVKATSMAFILLLGISFFYRGFSFSREYLVTAWILVPLCVIAARLVLSLGYVLYRRSSGKFNEVLIIGTNRASSRYAVRIARQIRLCARVMGYLDDSFPTEKSYKKVPILGKVGDLNDVLTRNEHVNQVIVTATHISNKELVRIMNICEKHLVVFKWSPDIIALMAIKMNMHYEAGLPLLEMRESPLHNWENRLIKRVMDTLLSGLGLIILLPFLVLIACWVKIDSKGPWVYGQERVGEDGKLFKVLKFRTMQQDAESQSGPVWAKKDDARRTRIGGFLRASNIDELPQLWNIFVGDMSLVGPRPERPHFVGQFRENIPNYMGRHKIKSGLTGWAQVHGLRGDTSIEDRTKFDLYYLEHWSILLDIQILIKTVAAFKNAY